MPNKGDVTWTDIREHVPMSIGEQVHVNHDNCPAGVDTKRRLYIKNTSTAVLAYCHHCNGHYVKPKGKRTLAEVEEEVVSTAPTVDQDIPPDTTFDWNEFSVDARIWLLNTHLVKSTAYLRKIGYSPSWDRLILPVVNNGNIVLWQGRKLSGAGPKYVTHGDKSVVAIYQSQNFRAASTVVLTEDIVSAMRVAQDTGCDAIALLGTSLSDRVLSYLQYANYKRVLVWMDNDVPGQEAKHLIRNRLEPVLAAVVDSYSLPEPKLQAPSQLAEILAPYS